MSESVAVSDVNDRFLPLIRTSVEAILRNQLDDGAIIASRDFAQYHYCWLRDGSFNAHALDAAGEVEAAGRYHAWVNRTVHAIAGPIDDATQRARRGEPIDVALDAARALLARRRACSRRLAQLSDRRIRHVAVGVRSSSREPRRDQGSSRLSRQRAARR